MGRKLNPKKKTTISRKLPEEIQSPGVSGFMDYHYPEEHKFRNNPCEEIHNLPPAAESAMTFHSSGLVPKSIEEI